MHHHLFSYQIQPWNDVDTFAIGLHITRVASLAPWIPHRQSMDPSTRHGQSMPSMCIYWSYISNMINLSTLRKMNEHEWHASASWLHD